MNEILMTVALLLVIGLILYLFEYVIEKKIPRVNVEVVTFGASVLILLTLILAISFWYWSIGFNKLFSLISFLNFFMGWLLMRICTHEVEGGFWFHGFCISFISMSLLFLFSFAVDTEKAFSLGGKARWLYVIAKVLEPLRESRGPSRVLVLVCYFSILGAIGASLGKKK